ncbi:DUF4340 domain-containing protein [Enterocloster lavalensis]|uniref:DUF4340 domain-containing protein n=1 Tax=Enterocloster lavalensis TaxID=460384 RepID=UPI002A7FAFC6|nr:DUF4340 domain-containing protein [Enterocloster lavalensis]
MSQSKKISFAAAALLVLCAAYAGLTWQQKQSAGRALQEAESARVYVTDFGDVTGIAIENGDARLDFVEDNGTWYYAQDRDCPIRQTTLTNLADQLAALPATRKLENADELASYGLADPKIRFEITTGQQTPATLLIGNQVKAAGSSDIDQAPEEYYACISGGSQVYTIDSSLAETAGKGLYDFIQTESLPTVSGADIRDIAITKGETTSHFVKKEVDGQGNIAWYRDTADTEANRLPDNSQLNNLAQAVSGLSIRSCVNYNATDEELGSYGLETPVMTLTWTCRKDGKDITTTLLIGSMNPEGTGYYVKLKDSKAVNLAGKENVDKVLNAEY